VKLLGAFVPILGVFFLSSEQIRKPRLRVALMSGGIVLFIVLLAVIIWVAININDGSDLIGDLILLLSSAVISVAVFLTKAQGSEIKAVAAG
jgi:hypothetical protein